MDAQSSKYATDSWLENPLIEVADSYKQSTFDPFFITMQVGSIGAHMLI